MKNMTLHRKNEALQASNTDLHTTVKRLEKENEELKPYKEKFTRLEKLVSRMQEFYQKHYPKEVKKFEYVMGYCKKKSMQL
ncbi:hypothetical protein AAHB50_31505 [Bacillus toyonensis]